jgi:Protein of unknown function (DUF3631)
VGGAWGECRRGKPISPHQLAKLLRSFCIAPKTVRIGIETPKGYDLADFQDAFERYSLDLMQTIRNTATTLGGEGERSIFRSATDKECGVSENGTLPNGENECGVVADEDPSDDGELA